MTTPSRSEIQKALEDIPSGTKVTVKLEDGSERTGSITGTDGDALSFEDSDGIDLDQVAGVFIDGETAGPE